MGSLGGDSLSRPVAPAASANPLERLQRFEQVTRGQCGPLGHEAAHGLRKRFAPALFTAQEPVGIGLERNGLRGHGGTMRGLLHSVKSRGPVDAKNAKGLRNFPEAQRRPEISSPAC